MNNLPTEILHNVFIQVPFKHRLECTLVCLHWYYILSKHSLLQEVEISDDRFLLWFSHMLPRRPILASQLQILKLELGYPTDKRALYNMLPNVRVIQSRAKYNIERQEDNSVITFEPRKPDSKLEILEDEDLCGLTRQLLQFGSCSRLKKLKLDLFDIDDPRNNIFIHLKSAPTLKELKLSFFEIGIADLEIIHENTPMLRTLELYKISVIFTESPRNILPNTYVTTLKIDMEKIEDDLIHHDWFNYLAKKYTNLTHFDYRDKTWHSSPRAIKSFKIYRERIFPIYRKFGIPIPYMRIENLPIEFNFFVTVDELGLRVSKLHLDGYKELPIFEQLVASDQSKYVEYLEISRTKIATPAMLQNFASLTTVKIVGTSNFENTFNLSDYINAFPGTVTSFSGHFSRIDIKELLLKPNNIKDISFYCHTIHPHLTETISCCFPKLNRLFLRGQIKENINIHLPDNYFKSLSIQIIDSRDHGYLINNSRWSQPRYYIQRGALVNRTTANELRDLIIISLKFNITNFLQIGKLSIDI